MAKDAMNSSHAVSPAVKSSEEIEEMFDAISYVKVTSEVLANVLLISIDALAKFTQICFKSHL